EGAVAGLAIHPRVATQRHNGQPDYALAARLVEQLPVPVLISGGLHTPAAARAAFEQTGADAVLLARGSLGNPWLFEQLLGVRDDVDEPTAAEIVDELEWVIARAREHMGEDRAARYLRKFYPWYIDRLGLGRQVQAAVQTAPGTAAALTLIADAASV